MEADDISVKSINCILFKEKHIYQKINEKNYHRNTWCCRRATPCVSMINGKNTCFLKKFKFKISDMNDFEKLVFVDGEY